MEFDNATSDEFNMYGTGNNVQVRETSNHGFNLYTPQADDIRAGALELNDDKERLESTRILR